MSKAPQKTRVFIYVLFTIIVVGSIILTIPRDTNVTPKTPGKNSVNTLPKDTYQLKIGDAKTVRGIRFGFYNVESDDRCTFNPCDAPGRATIVLKVFQGITSQDIRVDTDNPLYFENFKISVEELNPIPVQNLKDAELMLKIEQLDQ